jgi:hypothetical protein
MKVAILGCGPAGLLAAHASVQAGHRTTVLSRKQRSTIGGAQFLHSAIPDLTMRSPDAEVMFRYLGTREQYAEKVYGHPQALVSWGMFQGTIGIWNMRRAYDTLWDEYHDLIQDIVLNESTVQHFVQGYDLVISTMPLKTLCKVGHMFTEQAVHIWYRPDPRPHQIEPNVIVYSGEQADAWYRYSVLFGWASTEWSRLPASQLPHVEIKRVTKPLVTNCSCHGNIHRVGRYGEWKKGVLVDGAYRDAVQIIARAEQGVEA